jgi:hypothetical protein
MRLGLADSLKRVLSSTNLIENLFSRVREIGWRVRRWQSGTMVLRWRQPARSKLSVASAKLLVIAQCRSSLSPSALMAPRPLGLR